MALKAQDIVVLLRVASWQGEWTYPKLADSLEMSASEVHAAIRRAQESGLFDGAQRRVVQQSLMEFLEHGLRYVFPIVRSGIGRGMPTAHAAPPLSDRISAGGTDLPPVWPDSKGEGRGETWKPLYRSVPAAARKDQRFYEIMTLVDALRGGRARERALAAEELSRRLVS